MIVGEVSYPDVKKPRSKIKCDCCDLSYSHGSYKKLMDNHKLIYFNTYSTEVEYSYSVLCHECFFDNLNKHGVIIITEKIIIDEIDNNKFSKNFHDFFKENKGYSKEEIDRKKIALENVMLLESEKQYEKRFNEIGCTNFFKWFQCYNFISWVLVK